MAKLLRKTDLPHPRSTRDGRDRLDLVTDAVPVAAKRARADRIVYRPGDTAARHWSLAGGARSPRRRPMAKQSVSSTLFRVRGLR
jgi:hypothetical protein